MNLLRALGALDMPGLMAVGFLDRRRRRRDREMPDARAAATHERPRPTRRELRRLGDALDSLVGFDLRGADLRGLPLVDADLSGLDLLDTDLCGADLRGANLRSARQLEMANLRNVRSDRTTRWPLGFVPVSDAARHL